MYFKLGSFATSLSLDVFLMHAQTMHVNDDAAAIGDQGYQIKDQICNAGCSDSGLDYLVLYSSQITAHCGGC